MCDTQSALAESTIISIWLRPQSLMSGKGFNIVELVMSRSNTIESPLTLQAPIQNTSLHVYHTGSRMNHIYDGSGHQK